MNSVLISLLATAALFAAAAIVGFRLGRFPKPYPVALLSIHIVLFFLVGIGVGVSMNKIEAALSPESLAIVALCCAGPPLIALLVTGIVLICIKTKKRGWIIAHKLAMYLLGLSVLGSGVFAVLKR